MASGDRTVRLWETDEWGRSADNSTEKCSNRFNVVFLQLRRPSDLGRARRKRPALGMGRDTARKTDKASAP